MSGVRAYPASSLSSRAVAYLEAGPADSRTLVRDVLGIPGARGETVERLAVTLLGADPRVTRETDGRWVLTRAAGRSPCLDDCHFAVVDVETTGRSSAAGGRIIEIAVAVLDRGRVSVVVDSLVDPGVPIPPVVSALTGITAAQVRGAPTFDRVADELLGALAGAVFVAHNVGHDWGFVASELVRARALVLAGPRLCTVRLARRLLPGLASRSLDAVAFALGIEIAARHRAAGDARATARVLQRLLGMAQERGAVTLADLGKLRIADSGLRIGGAEGRAANPQSAIDNPQ